MPLCLSMNLEPVEDEMKVGDLVMQRRASAKELWGVGYIIEVEECLHINNIPFVTVIWPLLDMKETTGSQAYLEVLQ